jgi:uncharacterized protein YndB with AHSA1/START domain
MSRETWISIINPLDAIVIVDNKKGQKMNAVNTTDTSVKTERLFAFTPREIFSAFEQPDKLARWWGPSGFTSTFTKFDFKPGGRWEFVMHGPDGTDYPNQSVFQVIEPDSRLVIGHVVEPFFTLTVTLTPRGTQTHLSWVQQFASSEVASQLRPMVTPANEQVLDNLQAVLSGG